MLTVGELREMLEGIPDEAEVRIMIQANYPFECSVDRVWTPSEEGSEYVPGNGTDFGIPMESVTDEDGQPKVVYLVEKQQVGYGSADAFV